MPEYIDANSIELDSNVFDAGSFELDKEETTPSMWDRVTDFGAGLAHTVRAVDETVTALGRGLAAFPISKGAKWIEYGLTGDLDKAKAAEERTARRIQFEPTTEEAKGAMEQIGKYVLDPVFGTLKEIGQAPGEMWNAPVIRELGGDIAELGGPLLVGAGVKGLRGARERLKVREEPVERPAELIPERPVEIPTEPFKAEPAKVVPADSIKLDEAIPERRIATREPGDVWTVEKRLQMDTERFGSRIEPTPGPIVEPAANVKGKSLSEMTNQEWQDSRHVLRRLAESTDKPDVKAWAEAELSKYAKTHEEQIRFVKPGATAGGKPLAEMTPEEFAGQYGFKAKVEGNGIGGEWVGPDTISVTSNRNLGKASAGDWTGKNNPDFVSSVEYPQNIRSAAHEITHGIFTKDTEKAHVALKELQAAGVPKNVAFESLIDTGGLYLLEPKAITNPQVRGIMDRWLGKPPSPLAPEVGAKAEGITSIKNAVTLAEREARGLSEVEVETRRSNPVAFDEAKRRIDSGEVDPRLLAEELAKKPRPLTPEETAMLTIDRQKIKTDHKAAMDAVETSAKSGDAIAEAEARVKLQDIEEIYNTNDIAARLTGYEQGAGLQARKMMIDEDYSLTAMLQKQRVDSGKPVTPEMRTKLETLSKQIEEANAKIAAYEEKASQMQGSKAIERIKNEVAKEERQVKRTFAKGELSAEFDGLVKELNSVLGGQLNVGLDPMAVVILGKMAKNRVRSGIITVEGLVDSIYTEVKQWGLSKRDIRDAISGYGITAQMSKEAIAVQLRELKRQMRLISAFEDAKGGQIPLRSGLQRDLPSDTVRELGRKVQEAMRESGIDSTKTRTPEEQWKTSLDAVKTRLKHQITDLEKQIKTGEKTPKRIGIKYDIEALILKEQRDALKAIIEQTEGRPQMSAEQKVKNAISAVEKSIAEYERRIAEKDLVPEKKVSTTPETPALKALRDKRDKLQEQIEQMLKKAQGLGYPDVKRAEATIRTLQKSVTEYERRIKEQDLAPTKKKGGFPVEELPELVKLREARDWFRGTLEEMRKEARPVKTPEEISLQSFKTRTTNRIAELEGKLESGDFTTKQRRVTELDPEALELKFKLDKVIRSYNEAMMKDRLANRTVLQKVGAGIGETMNLSRAIKTSFDLSAVLRQGAFVAFGHPLRAAKSIPAMFKALMSEKGQFAVDLEIRNRTNYPLYEQGKLYLAEHGQKLSQMEEVYMSRWAEKIPGVGASQRAYTTFLNKLRADSFDAMAANLSKTGKPTPQELNAIANYVNVATGRGNMGMKENALVGLNTVFFAPRYVASRFQLLAGQPLYRGTANTRIMIAKEYARFLTGLGVVYTLGLSAGGTVETDPRSSDFGKIKFGNTRIDPLAGLSQTTVLIGRLLSGETKTAKGRIVPIRGDKIPYGSGNSADVMARFLRSKLSPVVGTGVDIAAGKDVVGQRVTAETLPEKLLMPLTINDIYEAMKEQGVPATPAMAILAIFGMGLQTYDPQKRNQDTLFDAFRQDVLGEPPESTERGVRAARQRMRAR